MLDKSNHTASCAAKELGRRTRACSALGDYAAPLSAVRCLVTCSEVVARALTSLPEWLPNLSQHTGRGIEVGPLAAHCTCQKG
jgi:hypothetical protein